MSPGKRSAGSAGPASRAAIAALAVLGLAFASCHPGEAQETLLVAGSTTLSAYLAPVVTAFQKQHPRASIVSEPGGSTAGLIALKRGAIDVATVARDVTADEDDPNLRDYLVARDGIAIIVNTANPIEDVTKHQVAQICTAEVRAWKDLAAAGVGAADLERLGAIALVDRKKDSRARKSLIDLVLDGDDGMRGSREVGTGEEMVAAIRADPRAVGFVTLKTLAKDSAGVKALGVEHVPMTRATMLSGRYPLTRSFYLAVYGQASKLSEDFVSFTLGAEGQKILDEDGLLGVH